MTLKVEEKIAALKGVVNTLNDAGYHRVANFTERCLVLRPEHAVNYMEMVRTGSGLPEETREAYVAEFERAYAEKDYVALEQLLTQRELALATEVVKI